MVYDGIGSQGKYPQKIEIMKIAYLMSGVHHAAYHPKMSHNKGIVSFAALTRMLRLRLRTAHARRYAAMPMSLARALDIGRILIDRSFQFNLKSWSFVWTNYRVGRTDQVALEAT